MAGSTIPGFVVSVVVEDHPRVGGEHGLRVAATEPEPGSSPRWRGAQLPPCAGDQVPGIIPALAGSTGRSACGSGSGRDHPRVGGEHPSIEDLVASMGGSSPRWRGARPGAREPRCAVGIIPALAGSTVMGPPSSPWRRDHPRVGGKHQSQFGRVAARRGSSPRWRGAHHLEPATRSENRIIPALAGSTDPRRPTPPRRLDHPRVGGEHR